MHFRVQFKICSRPIQVTSFQMQNINNPHYDLATDGRYVHSMYSNIQL